MDFGDIHTFVILRHLRFLLKAAEEMLRHQPSLTDLQNQATVTKTEIRAIQTQLATNTKNQGLDHASSAEEKDGRVNEKYAFILTFC
jgi:hypothetical protein